MAQGKKWDKEKVTEVLRPFLQLGYSVTKACACAGLAQQTFQTWLDKDKELRLKVQGWQNEIAVAARRNVSEAIKKDGKMSASYWFLERVERDDFSTKTESVVVDDTKKKIADSLTTIARHITNKTTAKGKPTKSV